MLRIKQVILINLLLLLISGCANQSTFYFVDESLVPNKPNLLFMEPPIYPAKLLSQGIEGYVIFEYNVSAEGKVENIQLLEEYPQQLFRQAAFQSLKSSLYIPPKIDGLAASVDKQVRRISFVINGQNSSAVALKQRNCANSSPQWVEKLKCTKIQ